jgi:hypothetical protein
MPNSVRFDEGRGFLHISVVGAVSDVELLALNKQVREEPALMADCPILYDCSDVTEISISAGLIDALATNARHDKNLVAMIAPTPAAFRLARMFQTLADVEGNRIQVFVGVAKALAWLGVKNASHDIERSHGPT